MFFFRKRAEALWAWCFRDAVTKNPSYSCTLCLGYWRSDCDSESVADSFINLSQDQAGTSSTCLLMRLSAGLIKLFILLIFHLTKHMQQNNPCWSAARTGERIKKKDDRRILCSLSFFLLLILCLSLSPFLLRFLHLMLQNQYCSMENKQNKQLVWSVINIITECIDLPASII